MDGFGTELGFGSMALVVGKIVIDIIKEWRAKKEAVKVVEANGNKVSKSNPPEPASAANSVKGGTSTNLVLHLLTEHGNQLERLDVDVGKLGEKFDDKMGKLKDEMTEVRVDVGKCKQELNIRD